MSKDLTTRQWELYRHLKNNYSDDKYISKKEIVENVQGYEVKDGETRFCRDIEFDVRIINDNEDIQKIIVSCSKGYKIGTPEQVHDYLVSREIEAKNSLKLTYKLRRKAEKNNQFRIKFGKYERDVIEAYLRESTKNNLEDKKND